MEVEYEPIKKVVILEVIDYSSPEKFAEAVAPGKMAGQPVVLSWADGVLFGHNPLPPSTDKLMDEFTKGIVYWNNVSYALMPEYKPIIKVDFKTGGTAEIGVTDVSMNKNLLRAASWLKDYSPSKS